MSQMEILKDLHIRCDKCGKEYLINKDYLEYDSECIDERQMGAEFEHDFSGEKECDNCGNWMYFKVRVFEYPEGAFNSYDTETRGCEFIKKPVFSIDWSYEFDYPLYIEEDLCKLITEAEVNIYSVANNPDKIYTLTPAQFEDLVAEVFRKRGFDVRVTQRTRDGGKDIIASYNMSGIPCMLIIECKRYAAGNKVGVGIVRALHGVQQAEHYGKAVLVTSSSFSSDAKKFANDLRDMVVLIDFKQLMEMINEIE